MAPYCKACHWSSQFLVYNVSSCALAYWGVDCHFQFETILVRHFGASPIPRKHINNRDHRYGTLFQRADSNDIWCTKNLREWRAKPRRSSFDRWQAAWPPFRVHFFMDHSWYDGSKSTFERCSGLAGDVFPRARRDCSLDHLSTCWLPNEARLWLLRAVHTLDIFPSFHR